MPVAINAQLKADISLFLSEAIDVLDKLNDGVRRSRPNTSERYRVVESAGKVLANKLPALASAAVVSCEQKGERNLVESRLDPVVIALRELCGNSSRQQWGLGEWGERCAKARELIVDLVATYNAIEVPVHSDKAQPAPQVHAKKTTPKKKTTKKKKGVGIGQCGPGGEPVRTTRPVSIAFAAERFFDCADETLLRMIEGKSVRAKRISRNRWVFDCDEVDREGKADAHEFDPGVPPP